MLRMLSSLHGELKRFSEHCEVSEVLLSCFFKDRRRRAHGGTNEDGNATSGRAAGDSPLLCSARRPSAARGAVEARRRLTLVCVGDNVGRLPTWPAGLGGEGVAALCIIYIRSIVACKLREHLWVDAVRTYNFVILKTHRLISLRNILYDASTHTVLTPLRGVCRASCLQYLLRGGYTHNAACFSATSALPVLPHSFHTPAALATSMSARLSSIPQSAGCSCSCRQRSSCTSRRSCSSTTMRSVSRQPRRRRQLLRPPRRQLLQPPRRRQLLRPPQLPPPH